MVYKPISGNSFILMPHCSLGSSICRFLTSDVVLLENWIWTAIMFGSTVKGCLLKQYSTARPSPLILCRSSYIFTELHAAIVLGRESTHTGEAHSLEMRDHTQILTWTSNQHVQDKGLYCSTNVKILHCTWQLELGIHVMQFFALASFINNGDGHYSY